MKIAIENIESVRNIIPRIECSIPGLKLVFPLDIKVKNIDEFGIERKRYQAETAYGNNFIPLLVGEKSLLKTRLGYGSTAKLITFDLAGFFQLIEQPKLTEEEKDILSKYEVCAIPEFDLYLTDNDLKEKF